MLIEKKIVSQEVQEEIASEKIITEDQAVAGFNKLLNILKISTDHGYDNDFIATDAQVTNAVIKFKNHPSIIMIKNKKKKMIKVILLAL